MIDKLKVRQTSDPCDPLFKSFIGHNAIRSVPKSQREHCARRYFDLERLAPFQFARRGACGPKIFRDPAQLMRRQSTYRVAEFYYPILTHPMPGLRRLTQTVFQLQGKDRLTLILDGRPHRRYAGQFHPLRQQIHLADTLSIRRAQSSGGLDANTLYHEIGHLLMSLLYQGRFPRYVGPHHDPQHRGLTAQTSPGAAWSEGFANGIGLLDYAEDDQIHPWDLQTAEGKRWLRLPIRARLSNEHVIGSILGYYIRSEVSRQREGREEIHILFDEAAAGRFEKIVQTMLTTGHHRNFQEFVVDFLKQNPEEGERLLPILDRFGLSDLISPRSRHSPRPPSNPR